MRNSDSAQLSVSINIQATASQLQSFAILNHYAPTSLVDVVISQRFAATSRRPSGNIGSIARACNKILMLSSFRLRQEKIRNCQTKVISFHSKWLSFGSILYKPRVKLSYVLQPRYVM